VNQTDDITELFRRVGGQSVHYQEFPAAPPFVTPVQESDGAGQYPVTASAEAVQLVDSRLDLADLFVRLANTVSVRPRNSVV
jgi:hypothetical protein